MLLQLLTLQRQPACEFKMEKVPLSRRKKLTKLTCRGLPKRLSILRKSYYMRRWLLRNPWLHPILIFNYAAITIQKRMRGFLRRNQLLKSKSSKSIASKRSKIVKKRQLDKYLQAIDKYNIGNSKIRKPKWLDDGYSSWCASRLQSWWRMVRARRRHFLQYRFVNQISAIIIQMTWRNHKYKKSLIKKKVTLTPSEVRRDAAISIQLSWRSYCNRRIFRYFNELVRFKLKGAPHELLRTIIPHESELLDRAAAVHVRFRLGGSIFPPKIYFKIFTHNPLCDVNSFAPRDYSNEKTSDHINALNTAAKHNPKKVPTTIRVGKSYFGTKIVTNTDVRDWYKREENNPWRPISSQIIDETFAPPWLKETLQRRKPAPFHFSRLQRRQDIAAQKKRRKREWMLKAYRLASNNANPDNSTPDELIIEQISERLHTIANPDYHRQRTGTSSPVTRPDSSIDSDYKSYTNQLYGIYSSFDEKESSLVSSQQGIRNPAHSREIEDDSYIAPSKKAPTVKLDADMDDLLKWSMALDFDEYKKEWSQLATSMPSNADYKNMYKIAVNHSEEVKSIYFDNSRK